MRPLRVLHIIDSLHVGGAEQLLVTLARFSDRNEVDLRVCSLHPLDETSAVVRELRSLEIPIYVIGGRLRHNPIHVSQVAGLVWRERIDVVHAHLPYATAIGVLSGRVAGRPVIATLHSIRDTRQLWASPKHMFTALALRWGADLVVGVSSAVAGAAHDNLGVASHKLRVVPNAIDVSSFTDIDPEQLAACRLELLEGSEGPLITSVGRLHPSKGHVYLVEAAPRVLEVYPNARIAIVGGSGTSEARVRARIQALGLQKRVILTGPRTDIPRLLAASDVIALPSLWEGLPLVLLEAMASATPVVATAVGGIPGVMQDGVDGRLVPPCDSSALALALCDLLAHPTMARLFGQSGRARVQAGYAADVWARRLEVTYRELAA